jgi:CubicO group peptidase (beta-lactamase class C family)
MPLSVTARVLALLLAAAAVCGAADRQAPWPTRAWSRSSPEQQGLDGGRLQDLVGLIRAGVDYPDVHSLLIVRHGYLVTEEYFYGVQAGQAHSLQSVSKSVTSALIGIAIDRGVMRGTEERTLAGFFPNVEGLRNVDDRKRRMTLGDLLTMRSGTDYHEGTPGSPHDQLNALQRGWDLFYLNRPMVREPGTEFQYDSGGVILMSSLIKARTGVHADVFAAQHLFPTLGITSMDWYKNLEDHPHTGGGLSLTSTDLARFGLLYLRGGRWEDRQVVSRAWVEESTRTHVVLPTPWSRAVGYGYLWWIHEPVAPPGGGPRLPIYSARGARGQYLFVVPSHDMVVVVTSWSDGYDQVLPIEFLYSHILPAARR